MQESGPGPARSLAESSSPESQMICSWVAEMRHALDKPLHSGAVCEHATWEPTFVEMLQVLRAGHLRSWSGCFSSRLMGDAGRKGPALRQRFSAPHQLAAFRLPGGHPLLVLQSGLRPLHYSVVWSLLGSAFQGMHTSHVPSLHNPTSHAHD